MIVGMIMALNAPRANPIQRAINILKSAGPGAWYDPSDIANYTAAVGPELVTNGDNSSSLFNFGTLITTDTLARAVAPGGSYAASSTSTTSSATEHRFTDGIGLMLAGKTYRIRGRFYVPTGGISTFRVYDNSDGSWFNVNSTVKDQWVSFEVIRPAKASNWYLGIGDHVPTVIASGQISFWIDDFSVRELTGLSACTMFQDSAGTTPVTAVEQPVGLILDKSGGGNHLIQPTATSRPILSRRVNLLNKTAAGATWNAAVKTEIPNYFGEDVGFSLYQDGVAYGDSPFLVGTVSVSAGAKLTATALIDMSTVTGSGVTVGLLCFYQGGGAGLANAVLTKAGAVSVGYVSNITEVEVAGVLLYGSVYRVSVSAQLSQASASIRIYCGATNLASAVWGRPQITLATDASLTYQRVNTDTDYDADPAKFPAYLRFDGVDDAMQTGNIDFTGTDKMTVWAGVTTLLAGGNQYIAANDTATGRFALVADSFGSTQFESRGLSSGYAASAPSMSGQVLCGRGDISGDVAVLRRNGVQVATSATDQGTGNYGNAPLTIGARDTSSLYFNGRLYQLAIKGKAMTAAEIATVESYINSKTKAY